MSGMGVYLKSKLNLHIFNQVTYTLPANLYIGLHQTDPTEDDLATELADVNNYARVGVPCSATYWTEDADNVVSNDLPIIFPIPSGTGWGIVKYFSIKDTLAVGTGNLLFYGQFTWQNETLAGQTFVINPGLLKIEIGHLTV